MIFFEVESLAYIQKCLLFIIKLIIRKRKRSLKNRFMESPFCAIRHLLSGLVSCILICFRMKKAIVEYIHKKRDMPI